MSAVVQLVAVWLLVLVGTVALWTVLTHPSRPTPLQQMRDAIAADIEAAIQGHVPGDCAYNCVRCVTDSAYQLAADMARAGPAVEWTARDDSAVAALLRKAAGS